MRHTVNKHFHHETNPVECHQCDEPMRYQRKRNNPHFHYWSQRLQLALLVFLVAGFIWFQLVFVKRRRNGQLVDNTRLSTGLIRGGISGSRRKWINEESIPFNAKNVAKSAEHLIIVAGHSVTVSGHLEDADEDESDWFLLDYQKHQGLPAAIVAHIKAGIREASQDPKSLLIFSGGETRAQTGPETEGASYYRIADAMNLWRPSSSSDARARTITEEFARDSFENLMFSLARFYEVTGRYPTKITMVSFTFKKRRFETLHAAAIRWPPERFQFIGVDPPASTGFDLEKSQKGEDENAAKPFETDPYGCHSEKLQQKRRERNPFSRTAPYDVSVPGMKELLHYCGPQLIPQQMVPWTNLFQTSS